MNIKSRKFAPILILAILSLLGIITIVRQFLNVPSIVLFAMGLSMVCALFYGVYLYVCPSCKRLVTDIGARFCPYCSTSLVESHKTSSPQSPQPSQAKESFSSYFKTAKKYRFLARVVFVTAIIGSLILPSIFGRQRLYISVIAIVPLVFLYSFCVRKAAKCFYCGGLISNNIHHIWRKIGFCGACGKDIPLDKLNTM